MAGLFDPDRNCWRLARANRAAVIVDAADYYGFVRQAMLRAKHRILIIGWDFDPRIKLDPAKKETLGGFLLGLANTKPGVSIAILKWNFGAVKSLFRGSAMMWLARLAMTKAIRFKLDSAHPAGCSHHQKIVVIDDCFAICGGIDMTADRWDTSEHADGDPRRKRPNGKKYGPWHDATMAVDGDLAAKLGELAADRWERATEEKLPPIQNAEPIWPDGLKPQFTDAEFAIVRSCSAYKGHEQLKEVEALFVDMIAASKRLIYIETQYFTAPRIARAIIDRLQAPDPPEIVMIGPIKAEGWLEQVAMDAARVRLAQVIKRHDPGDRFRIYTPVTEQGHDIYVHAKVMIVDDEILRVGSSNMNNRSLGLDSECDLALRAESDEQREQIALLRARLLSEHLGVRLEDVQAKIAATESLLQTIDAFAGDGKTLKPLPLDEPTGTREFIAETELLDPKDPDEMFEGFAKHSLLSGLFRR